MPFLVSKSRAQPTETPFPPLRRSARAYPIRKIFPTGFSAYELDLRFDRAAPFLACVARSGDGARLRSADRQRKYAGSAQHSRRSATHSEVLLSAISHNRKPLRLLPAI